MKRLRSWWWMLLAIPVVIGISRLRFDVEILNLLPSKSPIVEGLKLFQEHFSNARELLVTIKSSDPELSEKTARALALELRQATHLVKSVAWQAPWQESPLDAAEMAAFLWLNQPPEIFGDLTNRLANTSITNVLAEAREQLTTSLSPNEIAFRGYDPYALLRLPESGLGDMASGSGQPVRVHGRGLLDADQRAARGHGPACTG